jgi:predicted DNA-binding transcriptional regulator YafY
MSGSETDSASLPNRLLLRRLLRYREWLVSGRGFTMEQALAELEVCQRTVYRDMDYVRTLGWDVEFCRQRRQWILAREGAPLPLVTFREGEMVALLVAEQALQCYEGTPYAAALRSAFQKLLPLLDAPVSLDLSDAPMPRLAGPPARPVEARQFERLLQACQQRRRLEITYHSLARDEVNTRQIDPYRVVLFGGKQYLIAYDYLRQSFRTFALGERIRAIQELDVTYAPDPEFDVDRYLAEGFGIFHGGPVEEVALSFSAAVARYVREGAWSETETKEQRPDGSLVLRMRVPVNIGLLRFVLQYGAEVEVLAPESLRSQVAETHRKALGVYCGGSAGRNGAIVTP